MPLPPLGTSVPPYVRWREFVERAGGPARDKDLVGEAVALNIFGILDVLYGGPDRHYHNWAHIGWCLDILNMEFLEAEPYPEWFTRVELALWFHDAIYDPKRKDNEKRSANVLIGAAALLGVDPKLASEAAFDVEATTHTITWTHPPCPVPTQWVLDIDLASLGFSAERFDENSAQIRQEYAFVPEDAFMAGRKAMLQGFLDRPRIYLTDECHKRFEGQARDNLQRAITALG